MVGLMITGLIILLVVINLPSHKKTNDKGFNWSDYFREDSQYHALKIKR